MDLETCETCALCYEGQLFDYTCGGCKHHKMDGFICMAFQDERSAMWMLGIDKQSEKCEAWTPRVKEKV